MFNEIKIDRNRLLESLKTNLAAHKKQYAEAKMAWLLDCKSILGYALDEFEAHESWPERPMKPEEFGREYATAIKAATMSVESELTLTEQEFRQFVMDEWDWSGRFLSNTVMYGKVKRRIG